MAELQQRAQLSAQSHGNFNEDGSVDIYIGPDKPEGGKAKNWIETLPEKAWFAYFRLYSPKQEFLDRTWVLPDIQKAK